MKEITRIRKLLEESYNGDPWLDVNLVDTLKKISAAVAAKKIHPQLNTIWEIVDHMIAWRQNVLERVKGNALQSPGDNYFRPVEDQSEIAWQDTMQVLKATQQEWLQFLEASDDALLEKIYAGYNSSYYKHIQGIIQHDVYHLGQIVLLAKIA